MNNNEKTTDVQATEYAAGVAKVCEDNCNPLPIEFIHLLETAYVAGYNHVCENNKRIMTTIPKHTRCPHHYNNVLVGVGCHQCPHNLGEADEGKSIECALGGPTQNK